jgi:hypothetical protein
MSSVGQKATTSFSGFVPSNPCPPLTTPHRKSSRSYPSRRQVLISAHSSIEFSSRSHNAKVAHLTSQLIASSLSTAASRRSDQDPDALDEDELFAELEEEIENDDGPLREQGLKELQREYARPLPFFSCTRLIIIGVVPASLGAQDGTFEANAGRHARKVHRTDRREGGHSDKCVSSLSRAV